MSGSSGSDRSVADRQPSGRFELVPIRRLRPHEEVDPEKLQEVEREIRQAGEVREPVLVADSTYVILNGHHRVEALRRLGVLRVPAWVVDYGHPSVVVDPYPGSSFPEPPTKEDILRRAREGRLYPPKTSRHRLTFSLPERITRLDELR
jgi:hypothetical protein